MRVERFVGLVLARYSYANAFRLALFEHFITGVLCAEMKGAWDDA